MSQTALQLIEPNRKRYDKQDPYSRDSNRLCNYPLPAVISWSEHMEACPNKNEQVNGNEAVQPVKIFSPFGTWN